jgi:hypothetical protein
LRWQYSYVDDESGLGVWYRTGYLQLRLLQNKYCSAFERTFREVAPSGIIVKALDDYMNASEASQLAIS